MNNTAKDHYGTQTVNSVFVTHSLNWDLWRVGAAKIFPKTVHEINVTQTKLQFENAKRYYTTGNAAAHERNYAKVASTNYGLFFSLLPGRVLTKYMQFLLTEH